MPEKTNTKNLIQILVFIAMTGFILVKDVIPLLSGKVHESAMEITMAVDAKRITILEIAMARLDNVPTDVAVIKESVGGIKESMGDLKRSLDKHMGIR